MSVSESMTDLPWLRKFGLAVTLPSWLFDKLGLVKGLPFSDQNVHCEDVDPVPVVLELNSWAK